MKDPILLTQIKRNGTAAQEMIEGLFKSNVFEILEVVQAAECINVTEIFEALEDLSQPNISIALRHLRRAGLVDRHRINKFKYYHIVPGSIGRLNHICAELAEGYDASVTVMDQLEVA